ncbi:MAG: PAS domain-containing protein, partial [Anaerolineae bacterium]|nr:PAS domain-containing protein [Anaerolineae bacterium]
MIALQFPPSVWILCLSAAASIALGYGVWRQRPGTGVTSFVWLMIAVTGWALGNVGEQIVVPFSAKYFFIRANYLWITMVPAIWLIFTAEYTGHTRWITRRNRWLLTIEPVTVMLLTSTNALHHTFWRDIVMIEAGGYPFLETHYGPTFWVHAVYSYTLILTGAIFLVHAMIRAPKLYRGQISFMLIGIFAPWIANAIFITGLSPLPNVDLTPLAFTVTGAAMGWSLYRFKLFNVVPVARNTVVESLSDVVFVLDQQNRIIDINPAGRQFMNMGENTFFIGKRPSEILPEYETIFAQFREVETARAEVTLGDPPQYFNLRISPLRNRHDELTARLVVLHEITEQRQAADQIRAQNEALRQANDELEMARAIAEESSRLKSEFLATISHELRTPLNSVIGYADLLLTGLAGELNAKQEDYVKRSLSNGERLLNLINELLDISKIEAGRFELHPHPFSITELLDGVRLRMQNLADQKGLTFTATLDPALPDVLEGDAHRIEQIIVNLVGNAIKYTNT